MVYVCVCDEQFKPEKAFAFLESIKKEFTQTIPKSSYQNPSSYYLNNEFQEKLKMKMDYYEKNLTDADDDVAKLKKVLIDEKNAILEAAEVLIVKKAENLTQESSNFYN